MLLARYLRESAAEPGTFTIEQESTGLVLGMAPSVDSWHLAPPGAAACDYGSVAGYNECEAAVSALASAAGTSPQRALQLGNTAVCDTGWGQVPPGCSAQSNGGDWAAHYRNGLHQAPQPTPFLDN